MSDAIRKDIEKLKRHLAHWERLLQEHKCDEEEGKTMVKGFRVAIASLEEDEKSQLGKDNNANTKEEDVGNINFLRMIEDLKEIGGDSFECKLNYRKDGVLYAIKISIEEIEHE